MSTFLQDKSPTVVALLSLGGIYVAFQLVLYLAAAHRRSIISRNHGCKPIPRFPHRDPILGLDVFWENAKLARDGGFLERVQSRYTQMGRYTFTQLFFGDAFIHTAEPANIKAVLATQFHDFELPPRRKAAFGPTFGHGIFTTDGKEWETSRALLRPNFTRSQVGDLVTFERHIEKLIQRIPRDGSTVDLQELFFMLTMDSATEFLFGSSSDVLGTDASRERGVKFQDAFACVTERTGLEARVGKLATLLPDKGFQDSKSFVHEYIGDYIRRAVSLRKAELVKRAEEDTSGRYVFLEELAKTSISEKKIQDELLNILLAGRDTTASLLSYVFYMLARRKDVLEKLRREIDELGNVAPTFEHLKSMKYLQYTLNEVLRLHPVVPSNTRICVKDTILPVGGGPDQKSPIFVKKGTSVAYQVYVMHRRRDLYGEDAEEFKPERWETLRLGWHYLPFNGGPRICIGQQFALTEAAYTTVRLLQAFMGVEPRDDAPFTDLLSLTAAVRGGTKVAMIPA
ncbi:cytochrome P450 52A1 [Diplocarpon rosae]|nr:cytochrome P450 52A1 [Diplocarpon rosae]